MELRLRSTLEELHELNGRDSNKIGLLKLISLVEPRSWSFRFTFHSDDVRLTIRSDPPLSLEDFATIADGRIPQLFDCKVLSFSGWTSPIDSDRVNVVELKNVGDEADELVLEGFSRNRLPPAFSNAAKVSEFVRRETWFGSEILFASVRRMRIEWSVYGDRHLILPKSWINASSTVGFHWSIETSIEDYPLNTVVSASSGVDLSLAVRHSRLGLFSNFVNTTTRITRDLRSSGLQVEFQEPTLQLQSGQQVGPIGAYHTIATRLTENIESALRSGEFGEYLAILEEEKRKEAAKALAIRQALVEKRELVYYRDTLLGCRSYSENDVILLLAKLESLNALPTSSFSILEHTPKIGIDAFAHFQLDQASLIHKYSPIELEYHFENFIQHKHLIEQVALIVCWDFKSESTKASSSLVKRREGLYIYSIDNRACPVLVLSEIDDLSIKRGDAR